jgi:hypothetical protein
MNALLRRRPDLSRDKLERIRLLRDAHAADALVTGYEDLIEGLKLPDPDDRHVPQYPQVSCRTGRRFRASRLALQLGMKESIRVVNRML